MSKLNKAKHAIELSNERFTVEKISRIKEAETQLAVRALLEKKSDNPVAMSDQLQALLAAESKYDLEPLVVQSWYEMDGATDYDQARAEHSPVTTPYGSNEHDELIVKTAHHTTDFDHTQARHSLMEASAREIEDRLLEVDGKFLEYGADFDVDIIDFSLTYRSNGNQDTNPDASNFGPAGGDFYVDNLDLEITFNNNDWSDELKGSIPDVESWVNSGDEASRADVIIEELLENKAFMESIKLATDTSDPQLEDSDLTVTWKDHSNISLQIDSQAPEMLKQA